MVEKRNSEREDCYLVATVRMGGIPYTGTIINLSQDGARVRTDRMTNAWINETCEIHSPELGCIEGKVRWTKGRDLGVQFRACSDTTAKLKAFRKHFLPGMLAQMAKKEAEKAKAQLITTKNFLGVIPPPPR